jgi:hypothetical protein
MQGTFWRKFAPRAVVVEADAFKENDVVYQALNEQEGGAVKWPGSLSRRLFSLWRNASRLATML